MNAQALQDALYELLAQTTDKDCTLADAPVVEIPAGLEALDRVSTFAEAGMLTTNAGLVLRTSDGSEFQLTIVQRR